MTKKGQILGLLIGLLSLFSWGSLFAQNVGIGSTSFTPDPKAMLEIKSPAGDSSVTKGVLIPRVTYRNRPYNPGAGGNGMLIYQTDDYLTNTHGFWYWDNMITTWLPFLSTSAASSTAGWLTLGNNGTTAYTNFIGTKDNQSFTIRTNNSQRVRIDSLGNVGIGTYIPSALLHVVGSGATTTNYWSGLISNTATSTTPSISKTGLEIQSTGTWSGASSKNTALAVTSVTGGTFNYDATFYGGGNVGVGTSTPDLARVQIADASTTASFAGLRIDMTGAYAAGANYGLFVAKTGASSINYGAFFSANGATSNTGAIGTTAADGGKGLWGLNSSTGSTSQNIGIRGDKSGSSGTGTGIGVYGNASGTATTNYGGYFTASGSTTTVGAYFSATGGTNNYALVVPPGSGNVGIGYSTPVALLHLYQATLNNEVIRIESQSTGDNVAEKVFQGRVLTANATATTILTLTPALIGLNDNSYGAGIKDTSIVLIEAHVVGRRYAGGGTADDGAGYVIRGTFKMSGTGAYNALPIGTVITGGSLVTGNVYTITTMGTTTAPQWVTAGASVGAVGNTFTAVGAGAGTGTATTNGLIDYTGESLAGYNVTMQVSGVNVVINAIGIAGTNMVWHTTAHVWKVGN